MSRYGTKETFDCSHTVFTLTTNLRVVGQTSAQLKASLTRRWLTPEIKGRINSVFRFAEFSDGERAVLVEHFVRAACRNVEVKDRSEEAPRRRLTLGPKVLDSLCADHMGREDVRQYGARHIQLVTQEAVGIAVRRFEMSSDEGTDGQPLVLGYDTDAAEPTEALTATLQ